MEIIDEALKKGRTALSEFESKKLLAQYDIPITKEVLVANENNLKEAIQEIGYPIVLKGCSAEIGHKTEKGLVQVGIHDEDEALFAFKRISELMNEAGSEVLVQEMVQGKRELVAGLKRDPQFGPCVMFGLGGIFTEILQDVCFRVAPIEEIDAFEMMDEIKGHKMLEAFRGMEPVDRTMLAKLLITIGQIGMEVEKIEEIDINPLIIRGNQPVAVDALILLK